MWLLEMQKWMHALRYMCRKIRKSVSVEFCNFLKVKLKEVCFGLFYESNLPCSYMNHDHPDTVLRQIFRLPNQESNSEQ